MFCGDAFVTDPNQKNMCASEAPTKHNKAKIMCAVCDVLPPRWPRERDVACQHAA